MTTAEEFALHLNEAMEQIEHANDKFRDLLSEIDREALRDGFQLFLTAWLERALADPSGQAKRRVKLHATFLIEQCGEALHDIKEKIRGAGDLMAWVDRAYDYAATIVNATDPNHFIRKFDTLVRPVSLLDPRSPEERAERRKLIQESFRDFLAQQGNRK